MQVINKKIYVLEAKKSGENFLDSITNLLAIEVGFINELLCLTIKPKQIIMLVQNALKVTIVGTLGMICQQWNLLFGKKS